MSISLLFERLMSIYFLYFDELTKAPHVNIIVLYKTIRHRTVRNRTIQPHGVTGGE